MVTLGKMVIPATIAPIVTVDIRRIVVTNVFVAMIATSVIVETTLTNVPIANVVRIVAIDPFATIVATGKALFGARSAIIGAVDFHGMIGAFAAFATSVTVGIKLKVDSFVKGRATLFADYVACPAVYPKVARFATMIA